MSDQDDPQGKTPSEPPSKAGPKAKDELFEAIDHFRSAANILFDRATKDPTVQNATAEAERLMQKIGATAEPLARQLTSEIGRLTRKISDAVEGRRKSDAPPPPADDDQD